MKFLLVLAVTVLACFALRNAVKRVPWLFYALALALVGVFVASPYIDMPRELWNIVFFLMQKCALAVALFVVVMFVGVFPEGSRPWRWLKPIRAELSIVACILTLGHVYAYLESYLPRILAGSALNANVGISFVLGAVVFVLLVVLGTTSFSAVKRRMGAVAWKRVQMLAYPFFALVYAHLFVMLALAALRGGEAAAANLAVYTAVFAVYAVLRVRRRVVDGRAKAKAAA